MTTTFCDNLTKAYIITHLCILNGIIVESTIFALQANTHYIKHPDNVWSPDQVVHRWTVLKCSLFDNISLSLFLDNLSNSQTEEITCGISAVRLEEPMDISTGKSATNTEDDEKKNQRSETQPTSTQRKATFVRGVAIDTTVTVCVIEPLLAVARHCQIWHKALLSCPVSLKSFKMIEAPTQSRYRWDPCPLCGVAG